LALDWFNTGSGFTTATGLIPVTKPIDYLFVVPILANASGVAYFDDITVQQFTPSQPAVTIMFDDGNTTDFTVAKPILDAKGFKGTSAIITGNVGVDADTMTWTQIKSLASAGWNIVSHTVTHTNLTTLSSSQADSELSNSKNALTSQGLTINSVAYPMGAYNAAIIEQTRKYYSSGRSYESGENPLGVFPYGIKVRQVINTTTASDVTNWLNQAKTNKDWDVIVFHVLTATGDDVYHTDPAVFQSMINAIAASGVRVITYDQGIAQYAVSSTVAPPTCLPGTAYDFNNDGTIDLTDFTVMATNFNKAGGHTQGDVNNDGQINQADFDLFKTHFNQRTSAVTCSNATSNAVLPDITSATATPASSTTSVTPTTTTTPVKLVATSTAVLNTSRAPVSISEEIDE
jgi:peptidoglycan/xylan/chitin deacetylase (PgdA/CDA1 family)